MEMWMARYRPACHQHDVALALVIVSRDLFMGVLVWHLALPAMRAKLGPDGLSQEFRRRAVYSRLPDGSGNKPGELVLELRPVCRGRFP